MKKKQNCSLMKKNRCFWMNIVSTLVLLVSWRIVCNCRGQVLVPIFFAKGQLIITIINWSFVLFVFRVHCLQYKIVCEGIIVSIVGRITTLILNLGPILFMIRNQGCILNYAQLLVENVWLIDEEFGCHWHWIAWFVKPLEYL